MPFLSHRPPIQRPDKPIANSRFSATFRPSFMAKTSWINRNERKRASVKKYAALRAELKAKKDYAGLAQLPRDASPTRVVNRCQVSGRRRAFIRRFKISRLTFRELASSGLIPGVTKSSW
jgi:small subunit ribosomal protein S14